ncbi:MAG: hypothetical protein AAF597_04590 [Bacteroidota bacterium]
MENGNARDIPLRDLLLIIGDYLRAGIRYWWVAVFLGLLAGGYLAWEARRTPLAYVAPLSFVLNDSSGGGGVGSLLGQFGISSGGGTGTTPDKILALAKSQKIIHATLLDTVTVDDKADRLANHLLTVYDLPTEWELKPGQWPITAGTIGAMEEWEKALLKRLHMFVLGYENNILRISSEKKTEIIKVTVKSINEDLSMALATNLFARLSAFYTQESTGSSRASVEKLRYKADSVANALAAAEYQLATALDTRLDIQQQRGLLLQAQLDRQVQILSLSYAEILRNLETADFALSSRTPVFQTVDEPFTPLYRDQPNWKLQLIYGCLGGGFFGFLLVCVFKFYRSVMNPQP